MIGRRGRRRTAIGTVAVACTALLVVAGPVPTPAGASSLAVDTAVDLVDPTPGDSTCGTGAAGTCSLRAAIQEANALAGPDEIVLPAGTYVLSIAGTGEDAGAIGDLDVLDDLTIAGAGAGTTTIDGAGLDRVLHAVGAASLTVEGLAVTGGDVGPGGAFGAQGGGVLAEGPLVLTDVVVEANAATDLDATAAGGGVAAHGALTITGGAVRTNTVSGRAGTGRENGGGGIAAFGAATITGTEVSGNSVTATAQVGDAASYLNARGGGILLQGATSTLSGLTVADNSATAPSDRARGGGAFVAPPATGSFSSFALAGSTIERNTAGSGGGVAAEILDYTLFLEAAASMTLTDTDLVDNVATGSGGGVFVGGGTVMQVLRATIDGNSAAHHGGGVAAQGVTIGENPYLGSGAVEVTASLIHGNTAGDAGGGSAFLGGWGSTSFVDSTISGNHAGGVGGGASFVGDFGGGGFTRSTVVDNSVDDPYAPGGISMFAFGGAEGSVFGPQASGVDCWVADWFPGEPEPFYYLESWGWNADSDGTCFGDPITGDPTAPGPNAAPTDLPSIDPLLGPLADNGGPTPTHLPGIGSPLVDAGAPAGTECTGTDQRGVARPQLAGCDIGAVELDPQQVFSDVGPANPFFGAIWWAHELGLVAGYPDGTFRPANPVSRQALVAIVWRAAGAPAGPYPDPGFTDVAATNPFATAIAWAADAGLVAGYPDGTFRPADPVSRQALVAIAWRAVGAPPGPYPDPGFTDVAATNPFATAIAWAADAGIVVGYPDGTFRPADPVSRQALVAILLAAR